jgi:hypothetical protein
MAASCADPCPCPWQTAATAAVEAGWLPLAPHEALTLYEYNQTCNTAADLNATIDMVFVTHPLCVLSSLVYGASHLCSGSRRLSSAAAAVPSASATPPASTIASARTLLTQGARFIHHLKSGSETQVKRSILLFYVPDKSNPNDVGGGKLYWSEVSRWQVTHLNFYHCIEAREMRQRLGCG